MKIITTYDTRQSARRTAKLFERHNCQYQTKCLPQYRSRRFRVLDMKEVSAGDRWAVIDMGKYWNHSGLKTKAF